MLDNIKYLMSLKTIDKNIIEGNFELAFMTSHPKDINDEVNSLVFDFVNS